MAGFLDQRKQSKKNLKLVVKKMCMKTDSLLETRIAQIGAVLLAVGFAVQIWRNLTDS
jgi:hypothetical protein